jgi:hypothetical protein
MTVTNWMRGQILAADDLDAAFGNSLDKRGDVMTGLLTLAQDPIGPLDAVTKEYVDNAVVTGIPGGTYGFEISQLPPAWTNFQGSGNPGWISPHRFIFGRSGAGAQTDVGTVQIQRQTSFSGGDANHVNAGLTVTNTVNGNAADQEVGILGQVFTNGNAGFGIALWAQATRQAGAGSTEWIWGGLINAKDLTGLDSTGAGQAVIGLEVDANAVRADNAANAATWGGAGIRKALQISCHRSFDDGGIQYEISNGIWFCTGTTAGSGGIGSGAADVNYRSAIGFQSNCQTYSALDTRGAIPPAGSSNPLIAVNMNAGHVIDLNGGPNLNSAPGAYLQYRSGTGRLYYVVAGVDMWSVDGSGNVRAKGTVTGSTTP